MQAGEVAVLAGTGSDPAGRVAYVKTVQPGSVPSGTAHPGRVDPGAVVHPSSGSVHPGTVVVEPGSGSDVRPGVPRAGDVSRSDDVSYDGSGSGAAVKHIVISADINTGQVSRRPSQLCRCHFLIFSTHMSRWISVDCMTQSLEDASSDNWH